MSPPVADGLIVNRPPLAGRVGSVFVTVLIAALGLFMLGATAVVIAGGQLGVGLFLLAIAGFMVALFWYCLRDTRGKLGWRVGVGPDRLQLDLSRGRSLVHRLDPVHMTLPYGDIAAIETRLEAYPSFGMVNMQRAFALKLRSGDLIILGEDRALRTALATATLAKTVGQILRHAALELRDRGMVKGQGGFLGILFVSAPPWDTPSLDDEAQAVLLRKARLTGAMAQAGIVVTR